MNTEEKSFNRKISRASGAEDLVIEFLEPELDGDELVDIDDDGTGITEFVEESDNPNLNVVDVSDVGDEISEYLSPELKEEVSDFISEYEEEVSDKIIVPGSPGVAMSDGNEAPEEVSKTWADDRDSSMFMDYLQGSYPGGIPQHDGSSMLGCEKAILYLGKLNNEISEALRLDSEDSLDISGLEDYRVKIMSDIVILKNRLSSLKKKLNQSEREKMGFSKPSLSKEATTPKVQVVVTPFERAIAGILVNSVVSGGKPFEDVYDHLKDKYKLSDRDELSVMQILMDSGYHIFKDRGAIGESAEDVDDGGNPTLYGLDFIKNYFS